MGKIHYRFVGMALQQPTWEFRGKITILAKTRDFAKMDESEGNRWVSRAPNLFLKSFWTREKIFKFLSPKNEIWGKFTTVLWGWPYSSPRGNLGGKSPFWQKHVILPKRMTLSVSDGPVGLQICF